MPCAEENPATQIARLRTLGIGPPPTALAERALQLLLAGAERFRKRECVNQGAGPRVEDLDIDVDELTPSAVVLASECTAVDAAFDQPSGELLTVKCKGRLDDAHALHAVAATVRGGARLVVVLSQAPAAVLSSSSSRRSAQQHGRSESMAVPAWTTSSSSPTEGMQHYQQHRQQQQKEQQMEQQQQQQQPPCGSTSRLRQLKASASCPSLVAMDDFSEDDDDLIATPTAGTSPPAHGDTLAAGSSGSTAPPAGGAAAVVAVAGGALPVLPTCCAAGGLRRPRLGAEAPANAYVAALLAWQLILTELPADVAEEVVVVAGEHDPQQRRTRLVQVLRPTCPGWRAGLAATAELGRPPALRTACC